MASVTLSMEEYNELQSRERQVRQELVEIKRQLVEAKLADPTERVQRLQELSRALLGVLRFALANLPSITIPNWPTASLRAVGLNLTHLPDYSDDDSTLAVEVLAFADEADRDDRERRRAKEAIG
jgi:hypothetical protein